MKSVLRTVLKSAGDNVAFRPASAHAAHVGFHWPRRDDEEGSENLDFVMHLLLDPRKVTCVLHL